ncbi:DNA-binding protein [Burkholderia ubonensis]|uniref:DNA-binding protein n=2 Tax=Burkholderia ubonensis TaxID=101571 RepID=A0A104XKJ1_9BURK|nr:MULTISPECIES: H-NS histone family protein [Burkholderia]AJX14407.1 H-NS histone family protein [Burkholderia ubonensis MSMB22]KIP16553.1 H-NS histone family protein [Burkholderia sp. MSHR3999]KVA76645.1 DNA-binding protein [Burkholderia ubonensis]KVC93039.1 DNA-binding protein [Burkholderia ubonensis]KVC96073.1 DNA-binding protein [Burkholderia ubonensis]
MSELYSETYRELQARLKSVSEAAEIARKKEAADAIKAIRQTVCQYGISAEDIFGRAKPNGGRGKRRGSVAPKYRNPETGATWSGRGRPPLWIAGRSRDAFLITRQRERDAR